MSIRISIATEPPKMTPTDVLAVPVFVGDKEMKRVPQPLRDAVKRRMKSVQFTGTWGTSELFAAPTTRHAAFVGLLGMGDQEMPLARRKEGARRAVGRVVQEMRRHLVRHLVIDIRSVADQAEIAAALIEGAELASYRFTEYLPRLQAEQASRSLQKMTFIVSEEDRKLTKTRVLSQQAVMGGVELTRQLVNQPASVLAPRSLVTIAESIAKNSPHISLKTYDR